MITPRSTVLPLAMLQPGVLLPAPIYDGQHPELLLLGAGTRLSAANLKRLRQRGISQVSIDSAHARSVSKGEAAHASPSAEVSPRQPLIQRIQRPAGRHYDPVIRDRFTQKTTARTGELASFYHSVEQHQPASGSAVREMTVESVEMLMVDLDLFARLAIEPQNDEAAYRHCLRAAQLAMSIATVMGHRLDEIEQVGIGCLISRAGMTPEARRLIEEQRRLTPVEMLEIKKNPLRTLAAMEAVAEIPFGARQVAYQIYERLDGSGYPRGRRGNQIHPLARIAAVADVFVALTSPRPHRPAYLPYRAVEQILQDTRAGLFDAAAIRGLLQTVSLFPLGSLVLLSDGRFARVVRNHPERYDRPLVEVLGPHGTSSNPGSLIDLNLDETRSVVEAIDPSELKLPDHAPRTAHSASPA